MFPTTMVSISLKNITKKIMKGFIYSFSSEKDSLTTEVMLTFQLKKKCKERDLLETSSSRQKK